ELPPLIVTGPTPLPSMVIDCDVLVNESVLLTVIVLALPNAVESKLIVAALVSLSALVTAAARLPEPELLVFVTVQVLGTRRLSSVSICRGARAGFRRLRGRADDNLNRFRIQPRVGFASIKHLLAI